MKVIYTLILSTFILSCASDESKYSVEEHSQQGNESIANGNYMLNDIKKMTADKVCESANDCDAIGVGARACGGPDEYLIYSKVSTDENKLRLLTNKFNEIRKSMNQEKGVVGICVVETKPEISCESNQCSRHDNSISKSL